MRSQGETPGSFHFQKWILYVNKEQEMNGADRNMNTAEHIASLAVEAMLYEVSTTPKPGLVDRNNNGAHHDMDFFTFMSSAAALHGMFDELIHAGIAGRNKPITDLLPELRRIGLAAENKMFLFTKGVNTHLGMIFTLGMLCGACGWQIESENVPAAFSAEVTCSLVSTMCRGLCERDFGVLEQKSILTKGERMYVQYGVTGARGETESGYATVRSVSLPVYRKLRKNAVSVNDALAHTLLYLISETFDTNILSRHNWTAAEYTRNRAKEVLALGGMLTPEGKEAVLKMDQDLIRRYISPGGCADLLAVTHFLYSLEN